MSCTYCSHICCSGFIPEKLFSMWKMNAHEYGTLNTSMYFCFSEQTKVEDLAISSDL